MVRVELSGQEVELDENIARLVRACDRLPGLSTTSSCGGHENPDAQSGQQPFGQFYVSLCVTNWWEAWRGLTMLAALRFMHHFEGYISFGYDGPSNLADSHKLWAASPRQDHFRFVRVELHGASDPDRLARFVEGLVDDSSNHSA